MPDSEQNQKGHGWIEESAHEAFLLMGEMIEGLKDEQMKQKKQIAATSR
jgi:hypothetical protein